MSDSRLLELTSAVLQDSRLTALWPSCTALLRHGVWGTRAAALRLQPDASASAAMQPPRNANGAGAGPDASGHHMAEPAAHTATAANTLGGGLPHAGVRGHHTAGSADTSQRRTCRRRFTKQCCRSAASWSWPRSCYGRKPTTAKRNGCAHCACAMMQLACQNSCQPRFSRVCLPAICRCSDEADYLKSVP
jgi:hypothetical protein